MEGQTKLDGMDLPHAFTSRLRESGTFRFTMPKTLARSAVHRHTAASRSARPDSRLQHGLFDGVPSTTPRRPFSRFAQAPS